MIVSLTELPPAHRHAPAKEKERVYTRGKWKMVKKKNPCKQGFEEFFGITVTKEGPVPKFIPAALAKYYSQETAGSFSFTHGHCTMAHSGFSLANAKKEKNFIELEAGVEMTAALDYCKSYGAGGVAFRAEIVGGITVSIALASR